jgi:uncharacterized membrane protein YbhN (UPF0104 family)
VSWRPPEAAIESEATGPTEQPRRSCLRRVVLTSAVAVAFGAFVVAKHTDVSQAVASMRHARPGALLVCAILSAGIVVNLAALQARSQGLLGVHRPFRRTLRLTASGHFLNLISKSGGMAGAIGFAAESRRTGQSVHRTTAGCLLAELSTHLGLSALLVVAVPMIWRSGRLTTADVVALSVYALLTGLFVISVTAASRSRRAIRRLLALPHVAHASASRFLRRRAPATVVDDHRAADDLFLAVFEARAHRSRLRGVAAHAAGYPIIGCVLLWAVFEALRVPHGAEVILVTYAIGTTFTIVGVIPGGLGFAELSMLATLESYGLPAGRATAVVGLYRFFDLWLPLIAGGCALRRRTAVSVSIDR